MPNNGFLGNLTFPSSGMLFAWIALCAVLCALAGYMLGGLNSGIIISKLKYGDDIRKYGSGNAGMTNMLRTYGKWAALLTFLGDAAKALVSAIVGKLIFGDSGMYIAGLFCIIGHVYPVYYGFKGGKGVVTFAILVLMLDPVVFLILFTLFVILVSLTKYISLGSVICAFLYPIILSRLNEKNVFVIVSSMLIAIFVIWLHRANIQRLFSGTESKISLKSKNSSKELPSWLLATIIVLLVCASTLAIIFLISK